MSINFKIIGKRIRETRKLRKMSQAALAEKADLSAQYISQVENAKKKVSLQALIHIARSLEVSVDSLLYGNLSANPNEYQKEIADLLKDCSDFERRVLFEVVCAVKEIIRDSVNLNKESETKSYV